MSSSDEKTVSKSPFEMLQDRVEGEHPVDVVVASRLPQTEICEKIRDAVDELQNALDDRESLWYQVEELLSERNAARYEAYFNLGYEHGLAAGRAEAFDELRGRIDLDTGEFAERLRAFVKESDLPTPTVLAALLENAWIFAFDISPRDDS